MKNLILNELEKTINNSWFGCNWVSTGRWQVSSEVLDENCRFIEDFASAERIVKYADEEYNELKKVFYEIADEITISAFIDFIVYEYGSYVSTPNNDGGNITYELTITKKR